MRASAPKVPMTFGLALGVALAVAAVVAGCSGDEGAPRGTGRPAVDAGTDAAPTTPVRFYREYVRVEPAPGSTTVVADYYFRNESGRKVEQGIAYPFPVDRTHLYPYVVRVWEVDGDELKPMGFVHRETNVLWAMKLDPGETRTVRVEYVQEIREPRAIYIVTTTKSWERPIELAEFEFRIPPELAGSELSFEPDRTVTAGDTVVYYVSYRDFMPDEDLTVTW